MKNSLKTELRLTAMVFSNEGYAVEFECNYGIQIISYAKYYSIFENDETDQLWRKTFLKIFDGDEARKACLLSEIENWEMDVQDKNEMLELCRTTWESGVDDVEIMKIRSELERKAERRIAQELISIFQKNLESDSFSLNSATNEFYMYVPFIEKPNIKKTTLNPYSTIYWNPDKIFDSILELEQSLYENTATFGTKTVLKCCVDKEMEINDEKIKEIVSNLDLGLVLLYRV